MRIKGAILTLAIALSLACLYQLSFSWVTYRVEKKAKEYANGDYKKEFHYLDSVSGKVVYNFLFLKKYTYKDCKERMINLGLDLKGGMNVVLEVSEVDIVRSLSNFSPDTTFNKAILRAEEMQRNSQDDFISLFGRAFQQIDPNARLAVIFNTFELKDQISLSSSNSDVLNVLRKEADAAITNSFNILRSRIDKFGVVQPNIQKLETKGRILVELPGVKEQERVRKLLQGTANLEFYETYDNADIFNALAQANERVRDILKSNGTDTLVAQKPATQAPAAVDTSAKGKLAALKKIKTDTTKSDSLKGASTMPLFAVLMPNVTNEFRPIPGAKVGYAEVKDTSTVNYYLSLKQVRSLFPNNIRFFWTNKPSDVQFQSKEDKNAKIDMFELVAIKTSKDGRPVLTGDVITNARAEYGQNRSRAEVSMNMNSEGTKNWARITKENLNKSVAIVMDQAVYSYPVVTSEITGGSSQITGMKDYNEANDLAIVLKSGKMPAPAHIIQEEIVGPSLGQESVNASLISFIIAFIVVLGYMIFYYNRAGWIADIALMVNVFFIIGVLASLGAVLTLPGMAGIVLTLGMAVDANVIIYERIREELRHGKGLKLAISDGYKHAYSAIIDGNVTTILTGVILFIFGTGPIRGFATTLIIGILTSMFTAIFISRLIFDRLLEKNKDIPFSVPMTANLLQHVNFDFIGKRKIFYILSGTVIGLGIISMFTQGFNLGVDFKGGRTYVIRFDQNVNTVDLQKQLTVVFDGQAPEVKTYGSDNQVKITTKYMIDGTSDSKTDVDSLVEAKLYQGLKPVIGKNVDFKTFAADYRQSSMKVGSTISDDIKMSAVLAVIFSLIGIFIYIFARFRDWRFGLGGVVSLTHDVLVVLSVFSLLQSVMPFSLEIDQAFIAAVLTVIGYSINDSVIIFDRIREWTTLYPKRDRKDLFNGAMNSTLGRTMNTSLTTLFTLIVIFIFGGEVIRGFIFALLVGIGVGTYSSVMNAAPVVYDALTAKDRKAKKGVK
ncbi:MAG TPA: protein translocase subunit SecDF [Bacteroidales bacterium]|nr:protein translocase subunit SecDF [Bacteroidales bacterium]